MVREESNLIWVKLKISYVRVNIFQSKIHLNLATAKIVVIIVQIYSIFFIQQMFYINDQYVIRVHFTLRTHTLLDVQ